MVTAEVGARVNAVAAANLAAGWDLAESLDRAGLLLTDGRRKEVAALALDELIYQMEFQQPTTFQKLGGGQPTVADGVNGVIEFVKMYRKMFD